MSQEVRDDLEDPLGEWFDEVEEALLSDPAIDELSNVTRASVTRDGLLTSFQIDWDDMGDLIEEKCGPKLAAQIERIMRSTLGDLGVESDDVDDFNRWQQQALLDSASKIREPVETVRKELEKLLQKLAGKTPQEIAEGLAAKFDLYSSARLQAIAQTTATFTTGASQLNVWDGMGVEYRWLSMRDADVRDTHKRADGQAPDAEGYFTIGTDRMQHPGSGTQAKENVNCRCVLRPHFTGEQPAGGQNEGQIEDPELDFLLSFTRTVYDPWAESQGVD